jgi:hypothetical protein
LRAISSFGMVGLMFMRVHARCGHQVRPPVGHVADLV